jgi:DNA-binding protein WhiA
MSFTSEVKAEVALKEMEGNDARAELSALIQMTSSLSLTSEGMTVLVNVENAGVARRIAKLVKERYGGEINLFVKRKMNLRKNRVYGLRILYGAPALLGDLGIYSARGLLQKPLARITASDSNARAYLAGAFLASGSINPPEKSDYHLEITAANEEHGDFLISLLARFAIPAKSIERRGKCIVYVKQSEKIADFLRAIEADNCLMKFENVRISRDLSNSITRLNNIDIANEVKTQTAAAAQMQDIDLLEKDHKMSRLDEKLTAVVALRKSHPDASLNELCSIYEEKTGHSISKSGMKHRFVKLHEIAVSGHEGD